MVLSSQIPRERGYRRHMTSNRRRVLWPRIIGGTAVLLVVVALLYFWPRGESVSTSSKPSTPKDDRIANASIDGSASAFSIATDKRPESETRTESPKRKKETRTELIITSANGQVPPPTMPSDQLLAADLAQQQEHRLIPDASGPGTTDMETLPPQSRTEPQATVEVIERSVIPLSLKMSDTANAFNRARLLVAGNRLVDARQVLNALLIDNGQRLAPGEPETVRDELFRINQKLIFSSQVVEEDPLVLEHTVESGELLGSLGRRYKIPYQLIEQINDVDARRVWVGQKLKLIRGPFHAQVSKSTFRMDLFLDGLDGRRFFITSFSVGLGEDGSTPTGEWVVAKGRKVANPDWKNPRTSQYYKRDDPANPIGEFWIGLQGIDQSTRDKTSYGIHGTIEPKLIGTEASMGCIRLSAEDIIVVYNMLVEEYSTVLIVP